MHNQNRPETNKAADENLGFVNRCSWRYLNRNVTTSFNPFMIQSALINTSNTWQKELNHKVTIILYKSNKHTAWNDKKDIVKNCESVCNEED